jgi:hypothetical protein
MVCRRLLRKLGTPYGWPWRNAGGGFVHVDSAGRGPAATFIGPAGPEAGKLSSPTATSIRGCVTVFTNDGRHRYVALRVGALH